MTADELRKLQRAHERGEAAAAKLTAARNEGIYAALREGKTHAWIAEATGLSRGLVSKFAKRLAAEGGRDAA